MQNKRLGPRETGAASFTTKKHEVLAADLLMHRLDTLATAAVFPFAFVEVLLALCRKRRVALSRKLKDPYWYVQPGMYSQKYSSPVSR